MSDLGKTNYYGQNANRSYHGHTISRLKSLMQKSVRRGDSDLIPWIVFEISSFHYLYLLAQHLSSVFAGDDWNQQVNNHLKDIHRIAIKKERDECLSYTQDQWQTWSIAAEKKIASALRNILHRVLIISVEDCFNIWTTVLIQDDMAILFGHPEHEDYAKILTRVLHRLVYSTRIRLTSDIKSVYLLMMANKPYSASFVALHKSLQEDPSRFGLVGELGHLVKTLLDEISAEDSRFSPELQEATIEKIKTAKLSKKAQADGTGGLRHILKESPEIQRCALGMVHRLMEGSDLAFYWVKRLMEIEKLTIPIQRRKKTIYLVWYILDYIHLLEPRATKEARQEQKARQLMLHRMVSSLKKWYDDGNLGGVCDEKGKPKSYILPEGNLFLYFTIAIYVRRNLKLADGEYVLETAPSVESNLKVESLELTSKDIDKYRTMEPVIPGYARDMHDSSSKSQINGEIEKMLGEVKDMTETGLREYLPSKLPLLESFHSHRNSFVPLKSKVENGTVSKKEITEFLRREFRNKTHFARYGALIEGESKPLLNVPYRAIYDALKGVHPENQTNSTSDEIAEKVEVVEEKSSELESPQPQESVDTTDTADTTETVSEVNHISPPEQMEISGKVLLPDIISILTNTSSSSDETLQYPTYHIDTDIEANIQTAIRGQKLCGAGKIPVLVFRNHIIKGPYHLDKEGHSRKFHLNLSNSRAVAFLEESLALPESKKTSQTWLAILAIPETSRRYLVFQNVGSQEVELMTPEEADTSIEKGKKIACRGSLVDSVADYLDHSDEKRPLRFKKVVQATLQHFYLRYLLGIGDSNLRNIIVRRDFSEEQPRTVAGIDMEEIRGSYPPDDSRPLTLLLGNRAGKGLPKKEFRHILKKEMGSIDIFSPEDLVAGDILSRVAGFYRIPAEKISNWTKMFKDRVEIFSKAKK